MRKLKLALSVLIVGIFTSCSEPDNGVQIGTICCYDVIKKDFLYQTGSYGVTYRYTVKNDCTNETYTFQRSYSIVGIDIDIPEIGERYCGEEALEDRFNLDIIK